MSVFVFTPVLMSAAICVGVYASANYMDGDTSTLEGAVVRRIWELRKQIQKGFHDASAMRQAQFELETVRAMRESVSSESRPEVDSKLEQLDRENKEQIANLHARDVQKGLVSAAKDIEGNEVDAEAIKRARASVESAKQSLEKIPPGARAAVRESLKTVTSRLEAWEQMLVDRTTIADMLDKLDVLKAGVGDQAQIRTRIQWIRAMQRSDPHKIVTDQDRENVNKIVSALADTDSRIAAQLSEDKTDLGALTRMINKQVVWNKSDITDARNKFNALNESARNSIQNAYNKKLNAMNVIHEVQDPPLMTHPTIFSQALQAAQLLADEIVDKTDANKLMTVVLKWDPTKSKVDSTKAKNDLERIKKTLISRGANPRGDATTTGTSAATGTATGTTPKLGDLVKIVDKKWPGVVHALNELQLLGRQTGTDETRRTNAIANATNLTKTSGANMTDVKNWAKQLLNYIKTPPAGKPFTKTMYDIIEKDINHLKTNHSSDIDANAAIREFDAVTKGSLPDA